MDLWGAPSTAQRGQAYQSSAFPPSYQQQQSYGRPPPPFASQQSLPQQPYRTAPPSYSASMNAPFQTYEGDNQQNQQNQQPMYSSNQTYGNPQRQNNYQQQPRPQAQNNYQQQQPTSQYQPPQQRGSLQPYQQQQTGYGGASSQQRAVSHQQQQQGGGSSSYQPPIYSNSSAAAAASSNIRNIQSERKGNLALTGELALGRPVVQNGTLGIGSSSSGGNLGGGDYRQRPLNMTGGNLPPHPLSHPPASSQQYNNHLQKYQSNDIVAAQSSLQLLKSKRRSDIGGEDADDGYQMHRNNNSVKGGGEQSLASAEATKSNSQYRKVFKVDEDSGVPVTNNRLGAPIQQGGKYQQQQQQPSSQAPPQPLLAKGQYQSALQKNSYGDKQDPQMMYNAQRNGQMQQYEYNSSSGGGQDDGNLEFAHPSKRNNNKPTTTAAAAAAQQKYGGSSTTSTSASAFSSSKNVQKTDQNGQKFYNFNSKPPPSGKNGYDRAAEEEDEQDYVPAKQTPFKPQLAVAKSKQQQQQQQKQQYLQQYQPQQTQEQDDIKISGVASSQRGSGPQSSKYDLNKIDPREAVENIDGELIECTEGCGRSFAEAALEKHAKICKKVFQQKRKKFDMEARRVNNEGQAEINQQVKREEKRAMQQKGKGNAAAANKQQGNNKKAKWKQQSEQLRQIIERNRAIAGGQNVKDLPQEEQYDDREQCTHCNRKFNKETLARHQPACANRASVAKANGRPFAKR